MDWERILDWLDNPILVKHVRSRLRIQPLITMIVVVQVLCLCIAWAGYQLGTFASGGAFGLLMSLQAIILVIMGAAQVGTAVGGARGSGILDFHRVSPVSPAALTLGFFLGAPIREYVLFATTLPFSALCLAFGSPTVYGFVQLMIVLIAAAWLLHGLAILNALLSKPRTSSRGVVGVIVFVLFFGGYLALGLSRSAALVDYGLRLSFFGISLPWLAVVLIYVSALLFFIYLACVRRMTSDRIHPLTKPQAIAAMATLAVLLLGGIWKREEYAVLNIVTLYVLVIASIVLLAMVTPSQAEYYKGLWRARKQGRSHLPPWDDLSLNRVFLVIACTIVLVAATIAWQASPVPDLVVAGPVMSAFPLAIASGVLVVAYFGLALQFFQLRFGPRGLMYFGLFLFLAWILPMVAGTITLMASIPMNSNHPSQIVYGLSPVAGLGLTAAGAPQANVARGIQAAAITPPLLFTFVFNSLLVAARRRVYKAFVIAAEAQKPR
ncbi:MAG: hypothetical protein ACHRXM_23470 [Isosphaerales bacterium]